MATGQITAEIFTSSFGAGTAPATTTEKTHVLQTVPKSIWIRDVCELIDAAGPLTVGDIAGGLNAQVAQVMPVVEFLMGKNSLRVDEWDRLQLTGECHEHT